MLSDVVGECAEGLVRSAVLIGGFDEASMKALDSFGVCAPVHACGVCSARRGCRAGDRRALKKRAEREESIVL